MIRAEAYDCHLAAVRRETLHFARLNDRREVRHAAIRSETAKARQRVWRAWVAGWINRVLGL